MFLFNQQGVVDQFSLENPDALRLRVSASRIATALPAGTFPTSNPIRTGRGKSPEQPLDVTLDIPTGELTQRPPELELIPDHLLIPPLRMALEEAEGMPLATETLATWRTGGADSDAPTPPHYWINHSARDGG